MARADTLLHVAAQAGPKLGLHDALLGLKLAVMYGESSSVGLLKDLGSAVWRGVEDNNVGLSWSP